MFTFESGTERSQGVGQHQEVGMVLLWELVALVILIIMVMIILVLMRIKREETDSSEQGKFS